MLFTMVMPSVVHFMAGSFMMNNMGVYRAEAKHSQ